MKSTCILLFLAASCLWIGCREIAPLNDGGGCDNLPPSNSSRGYETQYPEASPFAPCYDPENGESFAYRLRSHASGQSDLYLYHPATGNRLLAENVRGNPEWSATDWVAFDGADFRIWKIKANGDSLTRIDQGYWDTSPLWSPDGQQLLFKRNDAQRDRVIIGNSDGVAQDTIDRESFDPMAWGQDGRVYGVWGTAIVPGVGATQINLGAYDPSNEQMELIHVIGGSNDPIASSITLGVDTDQDLIIWTSKVGIFQTEIATGTTRQIQEACDTRKYFQISIPIGKQQFATTEILNTLIEENTLQYEAEIITLNFEGMERKSLLD